MHRNQDSDAIAAALLAGGAVMGTGAIVSLVELNREAINKKGKEWGIENFATLVVSSSAVLGAAVGGLSMVLVTRTLARHADQKAVDRIQERLSRSRLEFESLRRLRLQGQIRESDHRAGVERLFWEITESRSR